MRDSLAADVFGERDNIAEVAAESSDKCSSDELDLLPQPGIYRSSLDTAATETIYIFFHCESS